jgi:hypothetical protein
MDDKALDPNAVAKRFKATDSLQDFLKSLRL